MLALDQFQKHVQRTIECFQFHLKSHTPDYCTKQIEKRLIQRKAARCTLGSGREARDTSVEVGHLPHVAEPCEEHEHAGEAEAEATVGRHAVAEEVEVELDGLQVDSLLDRLGGEHIQPMLALGAGGHLEPLPDKIEALGTTLRVAHVVEGAGVRRPVGHEDELMAIPLLYPSRDQAFALGVEVAVTLGGVVHLVAKDSKRLLHGEPRERQGGNDHLGPEGLEDLGSELVAHDLKDVGEPLLLDLHDVLVGVDPRHFGVHRGELRVVANRVRAVGPEHWSNLEHPSPAGGHGHLLEELRALGERGRGAEVRKGEELGSTFGCGSHELGAVHLGETVTDPPITHRVLNEGLESEDQTHLGPAKVQVAPVQAHVQCGVLVDGQGRLGQTHHLEAVGRDLHAAQLDMLVGRQYSFDDNRGLAGRFQNLLRELRVTGLEERDLDGPGLVADHQEEHLLGVAHRGQPSADADRHGRLGWRKHTNQGAVHLLSRILGLNRTVENTRERNSISDVGRPNEPAQEALQPHAKGDVGHHAVLAHLSDPSITGVPRLALLRHALVEHVHVHDLLGRAQQLPETFRRDEVGRTRELPIVGIDDVRERLYGAGISDDPERTIEQLTQHLFAVAADALAQRDLMPLLLQAGDRFSVADALIGRFALLARIARSKQSRHTLPFLATRLNGRAHEVLGERHDGLEVPVGELGLHVPVLHQVTTALGALAAKTRAHVVDRTDRVDRGLEVVPHALREEDGILIGGVTRKLERDRGAVFVQRDRRKHRRSELDDAVGIKPVAHDAHDRRTEARDGRQLGVTQVEMPVLEDVIGVARIEEVEGLTQTRRDGPRTGTDHFDSFCLQLDAVFAVDLMDRTCDTHRTFHPKTGKFYEPFRERRTTHHHLQRVIVNRDEIPEEGLPVNPKSGNPAQKRDLRSRCDDRNSPDGVRRHDVPLRL